jgi:hypothetical protein
MKVDRSLAFAAKRAVTRAACLLDLTHEQHCMSGQLCDIDFSGPLRFDLHASKCMESVLMRRAALCHTRTYVHDALQ